MCDGADGDDGIAGGNDGEHLNTRQLILGG